MKRRILGIETEYGLLFDPIKRTENIQEVEETARLLFAPLTAKYGTTSIFMTNGGRLYLDVGAHPEYASAECDQLGDLLAQEQAGDALLADLARQAEGKLAATGEGGNIHLFKNNQDSYGAAYGCHENYSISRAESLNEFTGALLTFLLTRQIIAGSGAVIEEKGQPKYIFSQRAEQIGAVISPATTNHRPMINTRDEPLAKAKNFRRLHVILGDSNISQCVTNFKFATTALVLEAIEKGIYFGDLLAANPLAALRQVSRTSWGRGKVELENGKSCCAIEIQQQFLTRIITFVDPHNIHEKAAVELWERTLGALEDRDGKNVETEVDWAAKYRLLDRYCERENISLSAPQVKKMELAYHDITSHGLGPRMHKMGLLKTLVNEAEIAAAKEDPPATTRAVLRGKVIRESQKRRRDLCADWTHLRLNSVSGSTVVLDDPFATSDIRVDKMIEKMGETNPMEPMG